MKRLLITCWLLFPLFALAQQSGLRKKNLTDDLQTYRVIELKYNWLFHEGDSAGMAAPGYNDVQWPVTATALYLRDNPRKPSERFSSIGWFRLHFIIDTGMVEVPLSLSITQFGASEIFVDGEKVDSFGVINGKDASRYFDPQYMPFVIVLHHAGEHVIAVRYANYNALRTEKIYHRVFAGFIMQMGKANGSISGHFVEILVKASTFIFLFGLFIALALLHALLYSYYKAARSNLYFSIFSFSIAFVFLISFLNRVATNPYTELHTVYYSLIIAAAACCSFSGFSNELFSKSKLRLRIITAISITVPFVYALHQYAGIILLTIIIGVVTLESIILTIAAIYKKVKGARIIGFGILFLALFFLAIVVTILVNGNVTISDAGYVGQIFALIGTCAVLSLPISMSAYLAWSFSSINKDLKNQLQQVRQLSEQTLEQEQEKKRLLENRKEELEKEVAIRTEEVTGQKDKIEKQHEELKKEKRKSDDLLLNILPAEVAEELKEKGSSEARFFNDVTVLFTDFVDFTKAGETMGPQALVNELHTCFKAFDEICAKYNIEKIKTIGDAYLAVCGLPQPEPNHAANIVLAALDIRQYMMARKKELGDKTFAIRIGIHSGSVVAGIVGVKKFAYDIWGDTVNTAARMEQHSETGKINISEVTYDLIKDKFSCTYRGKITAKNKGELSMYFVEEIRKPQA